MRNRAFQYKRDDERGITAAMTDKKKLLFVTIRLNSGGAERSLLNLLSMLSPEKYDIDLLLFKREGEFIDQIPPHVRLLEPPEDLKRLYSPIAGSGRYLPAKVLGTAMGKLMEPKLFEGRYYRWYHVYRHVLRPLPGKWDVAVAYLEGEPTYYVADFVDAKTKLCWVHSDYSASPLDPRYDAPAFEKMDHIITISAICLDALRKAFPQYADKMHVLENISASSIVQGQARAFVPEEFSADFNILSVGRLAEVKGFDFAIDAAALLKQRGRRFCWYIVGNGELKDALSAQIDQRQVSDCVKLLGARTNPYAYMLHADMLAQTSRWEGKSIVLDEAKMIGVPILCTRYNTVGNQIADGLEGIIVPISPEGIAEGIGRLMDDPQLRQRMVDYQRSQDYDNRSELVKYEQLLNEV